MGLLGASNPIRKTDARVDAPQYRAANARRIAPEQAREGRCAPAEKPGSGLSEMAGGVEAPCLMRRESSGGGRREGWNASEAKALTSQEAGWNVKDTLTDPYARTRCS